MDSRGGELMRTSVLSVAALIVVTGATPSVAQSNASEDRLRVSFNGMFQTTANDFTHTIRFEEFVEEGTIDSIYPVEAGPVFDGGVIVRLWQRLGAGVSVSSFQTKDDVSIEARIPHPFGFNRHREISGQASALKRQEIGVHAQLAYLIAVSDRVEVIVAGGPSYFSVKQAFVVDVQYAHEFPFDTATFQSAETANPSESGVGFNVGFDVAWRFSRNVGVGGMLRLSRATVDFSPSEGDDASLDVGGLNVGGGIRFSF
jgi:hypothetical protein